MLLIKHAGGWVTAYAHNRGTAGRARRPGQRGQVIARVGSTGSVNQPQLHFEMRKGKKAVDPTAVPAATERRRARAGSGLEPVDRVRDRRRSPTLTHVALHVRDVEASVRSTGASASCGGPRTQRRRGRVRRLAGRERARARVHLRPVVGRPRQNPGRGRVRASRLRLRQSRRGRPHRRRGARRKAAWSGSRARNPIRSATTAG